MPPRLVGADIVSVVTKLDRARWSQIIRPEHAHASLPGASNRDKTSSDRIADPLGLMQTIDLADHLAGLEVEDRNGIGAEFADEQTLAREVDRQVINAAGDFSERDGPLKREARLIGERRH
jgi:hypothetical protein